MSHTDASADYRLRADTGRVLTGAAKVHAEAAANAEDAASMIALAGGLEQVARKLGRDRAIALAVRAGHGSSTLVQNWLHEQARAEANTAASAARLASSYAADPMHDPRVMDAIRSGASDAELARVTAEVAAERSGPPHASTPGPAPLPVAMSPFMRLQPGDQRHGATQEWWESFRDHAGGELTVPRAAPAHQPMPAVTPADPYSASPSRVIPNVTPSVVPPAGSHAPAPGAARTFPEPGPVGTPQAEPPTAEGGRRLPEQPVATAAACLHIDQTTKHCGECGALLRSSM